LVFILLLASVAARSAILGRPHDDAEHHVPA
jgi:hypothetical protein